MKRKQMVTTSAFEKGKGGKPKRKVEKSGRKGREKRIKGENIHELGKGRNMLRGRGRGEREEKENHWRGEGSKRCDNTCGRGSRPLRGGMKGAEEGQEGGGRGKGMK